MHSLSKTKSTTDRKLSDISLANNITPNNSQDKQKQKLRDDLNQSRVDLSRIESECEDMNVEILKTLLSDVEDYNTKLEEK